MTAPRIVTIVQARMGSTRLPGKVLADLAGRPMLEQQLERLARAATHDSIVVATTGEKRDEPIAYVAQQLTYPVFRGSEDDVLGRYIGAARAHEADVVVRVTADCPLIDANVLDHVVESLLADHDSDYASNTLVRTYPRGLDVEALKLEALEHAHRDATDVRDREHVTRYVWRQPQRFRLRSVVSDEDHSDLRWTVDTKEDLDLIRAVYDDLYSQKPAFTYADVLHHAREHPELHYSNAHVHQRGA